MSAALASVDQQDCLADPLCAQLDGMLSELAAAVAACADLRDVGVGSDGERIDRIARLEKLKAAAGGVAGVRERAVRPVAGGAAAGGRGASQGGRAWDCGSDCAGPQGVTDRRLPAAQYRPGVVVRPAGDLPAVERGTDQ